MIAAVEDLLSEAVVRKMVAEVRPDLTLHQIMRKNGQGYIRSRIRELNRTAQKIPVMVVIDLDRPDPCPAELIQSILPITHARKLLFRVAVTEIESWVMADRDRFADFLAVPLASVPDEPDKLSRPKEFVVSLARKSNRKDIREDFVPAAGDTRVVGPAFNARMAAFVQKTWSLDSAVNASPSLRKAVERLRSAF